MRGPRRDQVLSGICAAVLSALVLLAVVGSAQAQRRVARAELKRVTGRVEILRKGQAQWVPAVVGAKLSEGDDIRAFSGASAELEMPDTSTLLVAENSRVVVTKLEFDPQNRTRLALFHLAVGKVRAVIAKAAITLVRARQSNFAISTPTAVAAARGTVEWVFYRPPDPAQGVPAQFLVAVARRDPTDVGLADCFPIDPQTGKLGAPKPVKEDQFNDCTKPVSQPLSVLTALDSDFLTPRNVHTAGSLVLEQSTATVTASAPPTAEIEEAVQAAPEAPPVAFTAEPPPVPEPNPVGGDTSLPPAIQPTATPGAAAPPPFTVE